MAHRLSYCMFSYRSCAVGDLALLVMTPTVPGHQMHPYTHEDMLNRMCTQTAWQSRQHCLHFLQPCPVMHAFFVALKPADASFSLGMRMQTCIFSFPCCSQHALSQSNQCSFCAGLISAARKVACARPEGNQPARASHADPIPAVQHCSAATNEL